MLKGQAVVVRSSVTLARWFSILFKCKTPAYSRPRLDHKQCPLQFKLSWYVSHSAKAIDDEWKKFRNSSWHNFKFLYLCFRSWKRKFHFSDSDISDIIFVRWAETWFMLRCWKLMVKCHVDRVDLRHIWAEKDITFLRRLWLCRFRNFKEFHFDLLTFRHPSCDVNLDESERISDSTRWRWKFGWNFSKSPIKISKSLNPRRMLSFDELQLPTEFVAKCA